MPFSEFRFLNGSSMPQGADVEGNVAGGQAVSASGVASAESQTRSGATPPNEDMDTITSVRVTTGMGTLGLPGGPIGAGAGRHFALVEVHLVGGSLDGAHPGTAYLITMDDNGTWNSTELQ